jgi:N-terminal domain on NACHT_NTPase and P-loop NTPases
LTLISSIITILDNVAQLYSTIKDTHHLPRAFGEVAERLPLVRSTLQTAEGYIRKYSVDGETCKVIKPIVEICKEKAERLESILQQITSEPDAARLQRYHLVVLMLGKENRVEELMTSILKDVQLVAENPAMQVRELSQAIQDLSEVPPSTLDSNPSHIFRNYDTDSQFNNTVSGTLSG